MEKLITLYYALGVREIMDGGELEEIGRLVVETYIKALNTRDSSLLQTCLHFPHIRILKDGDFQDWATAKEYLTGFEKRLQSDNWNSTRLLTIKTEKISPKKAHTSIEFERLRADGSIIGRYFSLYVISYENDYWGIRFGSGTG